MRCRTTGVNFCGVCDIYIQKTWLKVHSRSTARTSTLICYRRLVKRDQTHRCVSTTRLDLMHVVRGHDGMAEWMDGLMITKWGNTRVGGGSVSLFSSAGKLVPRSRWSITSGKSVRGVWNFLDKSHGNESGMLLICWGRFNLVTSLKVTSNRNEFEEIVVNVAILMVLLNQGYWYQSCKVRFVKSN